MEFFEWKQEYVTGVWEIDAHHKKLVSMINDAYKKMIKCENIIEKQPFILEIINELIDYGCYHFEAEEKIMLKYNFPEYEFHKQEHENFKIEVQRFLTEYNKGMILYSFAVVVFIRDWLITHVTGTDQLFVPFLSEKMKD